MSKQTKIIDLYGKLIFIPYMLAWYQYSNATILTFLGIKSISYFHNTLQKTMYT